MPRPRKCRRVCRLPENRGFTPLNTGTDGSPVVLSVDEYESIRLIDREGFSQEQCGEYMKIARTTVQQIYTVARKKLADALVEGRPLRIEGGDYQLCDGNADHCNRSFCCMRRCHREISNEKEKSTMKIAIPLDEDQCSVCPSFGRAPFYLMNNGESSEILANPAADAEGGAGLKAAQFLVDHCVTVVITPRCGQNSADVMQAAEMKIYKSQGSSAEENLEAFRDGKLEMLTHFHAGFQGIQ